MQVICLHDKKTIEQFLRSNTGLHIYSLGDLDDFFWPYTTWYAITTNNAPKAIILVYTGLRLPTLLALSDQLTFISDLLKSIIHILPCEFCAHLSPGLESAFQNDYELEPHGEHHKMALKNLCAVRSVDCSQVIRLSKSDLNDITQLYKDSYPGNWFDSRMLETDQCFGIRKDGELVSIAGVHVYSETYGVAALGNITTHPSWRRRGYGRLVTARLCQSLSEKVDCIGLNVKADNRSAISCYEKLGFESIASFGEFMVRKK
ncbi:MAG: GNAT family N-acetyltransferase [Candidatus Zixiibacteriota bacterium]